MQVHLLLAVAREVCACRLRAIGILHIRSQLEQVVGHLQVHMSIMIVIIIMIVMIVIVAFKLEAMGMYLRTSSHQNLISQIQKQLCAGGRVTSSTGVLVFKLL